MADKKISALGAMTAPAAADFLHVIDDNSGTYTNQKVTLTTLFQNVPTFVVFKDTVATSAADSLGIPITASIVHKTTGSDAEAGTIAAGTQGQLLMIVLIVDGGGTLTIAASSSVADTIAFADAEDTAQLLFTNSKWHFMGGTATVS